MEIIRDRNKRESAITVLIISMVTVILMLIMGMGIPDPPLETGIETIMDFGSDKTGQGEEKVEEVTEVQEVVEEVVAESTPVPVNSEESEMTQETEETIAATEETSNTTETEVTEEVPEQVADPKALYTGSSSSNNSSEGNTGDPGDQGDPSGTPNNNGTGTDGTGDTFVLSGRTMTKKPSLNNDTQETGKVVVNIWVDRYGKVKRATPGAKGSTTTNAQLYKIAKAAALKAKFSANSKAPEEQKGTIVFEFLSGQ